MPDFYACDLLVQLLHILMKKVQATELKTSGFFVVLKIRPAHPI